MITAEAHIETGADLAKAFIQEQARRAKNAIPGKLAGYELELPVVHFPELSPEEAIALESEMTAYFIERWNTHVAAETELQGNADYILEAEEIYLSPEEVKEIIASYEEILTFFDNSEQLYPEIVQGKERLRALQETGFHYTVAKGGRVHPDNHILTEIPAPPFENAFAPVSKAFSLVFQNTIADVNAKFQGILHMHTCAVADYGTYAKAYADEGAPFFSQKSRIPGADTPLSRILASRHLGPLKNPRISNDGIGMAHGGQHVTVGLAYPERLGDVLRVLTALTPALMILTENNGLNPDFPVRALHGSWVGQDPVNYPRMGVRFFDPNLTTEEIVTQSWQEIFESRIIVEMKLQGQHLIPTFVQPKKFDTTVNNYIDELWDRYGHIDGIDWDAVLRQQSKSWGVLRIREIPEISENQSGSELLIEYRPLDTQTPEHALVIQSIIQAIAQDKQVLDNLLNHFEQIGIIPKRNQPYTKDEFLEFETNLRNTALRALTGLDEKEKPLDVRGLATPYIGNPRYTLSSTANFLQYVMRKAEQPKEVERYLKDQTRAHAECAVARIYSDLQQNCA